MPSLSGSVSSSPESAPFIPKSLASPPGEHKAQQDAALFRRFAPAMLTVFLCVALAFSVLPIRNAVKKPRDNKDYTTWYDTGQVILHSEVLYPTDKPFPYMYPPLGAVIAFAPLSALGYTGMVAALVLINSAAWLACVLLSVRLVTGKVRNQHPLLYILPWACTLPFVWDTYFLGQVNIVLLALMLGAFNLLISPSQREGAGRWVPALSNSPTRSRQIGAGALIALAAATKAFPILALPYLIWRRHWTALASLLISLAVFLMVPAAVRGFDRNLADLTTWSKGMIFQETGDMIAQRGSVAFEFRNQSLLSIAHRLLRPVSAGDGDGEPFSINILSLTDTQAELVFAAFAFLVGLAYILLMPPKRRLTPFATAIEMSMLLILMVLFSPLAWTYFFCWLMPAFAAGFEYISRQGLQTPQGKRALAGMLIASLILLSALTQNFNQTLQAIGVTAWGAAALFVVLGCMLQKTAQPPGAHA